MREENQTIIKALNMFGRVPEQYELLNEIERLNNIINGIDDIIKNHYIVGHTVQNSSIDSILKEIKQLKESDNNE